MKTAVGYLLLLCVSEAAQAAPGTANDEPHFGSSCAYPEAALAAKEKGTTLVSYTGTRTGHIEDVKVRRSSGHADLDEATVQCVSRWRFDPGSRADQINIGVHRVNIDWDPVGTGERPVGRSIGIPHVCYGYYPNAELRAGVEGNTTLRFTITEKGEVRDLAIDSSSGNENLDKAALACASHWRYRPAVEKSVPVAAAWKAVVQWHVEAPKTPDFAEPPPDCLHAYPVKAEDLAGKDGVTDIQFTIIHGKVVDAEVTRSSGNRDLDDAAVQCIAKRRYARDSVDMDGRKLDDYRLTVRERIDWHDALKP